LLLAGANTTPRAFYVSPTLGEMNGFAPQTLGVRRRVFLPETAGARSCVRSDDKICSVGSLKGESRNERR